MGYTALAIVYAIIIAFFIWVHVNSNHPIIKFARIEFLYTILFGCFVGITSVIPLSAQYKISDSDAFQGSEYLYSIDDEVCT
jgi:nitrate/nitrite transporter NarK